MKRPNIENKTLWMITQGALGLLAAAGFLELMGLLTTLQTGGSLFIMPWTVIHQWFAGFKGPVLIAWVLALLIVTVGHLYTKNGIHRLISYYIAAGIVLLFAATWLGLLLFSFWQGVGMLYPWQLYALFDLLPQNSAVTLHLMICLALGYVLITIAIATHYYFKHHPSKKIHGDAHFASLFEIYKAGLLSKTGIILGKTKGLIVRAGGFESVLLNAPTGSGKTRSIAVPNLLEWEGSAVANDLKGELFQLTSRHRREKLDNQVYRFAPADTNMQTDGYNPFFYVSHDPNLMIRDIQLIAETLIPATKLGDAFWYQSSREILILLALYLFETKKMPTLAAIHDLSKQANFSDWLEGVAEEYETVNSIICQYCQSFLGVHEKTRSSILKDFHSRVALFSDPLVRNATDHNDFDFRNIRKEKMSIYLCIPDADKSRLNLVLTLFWTQLIDAMSQKIPNTNQEPYAVLGVMDEFGNMAKIEKLQCGLSFLRAYRMRCILIVQQFSQVISTYGQHDAKSFLNAKIRMAFTLNDYDDAKFFANALGQKAVQVQSHSVQNSMGNNEGNTSSHTSYQSKPLLSADQLLTLSRRNTIVLIEGYAPARIHKLKTTFEFFT